MHSFIVFQIDNIPYTMKNRKFTDETKYSLYQMYQQWLFEDIKSNHGISVISASELLGYFKSGDTVTQIDIANVEKQTSPIGKNKVPKLNLRC